MKTFKFFQNNTNYNQLVINIIKRKVDAGEVWRGITENITDNDGSRLTIHIIGGFRNSGRFICQYSVRSENFVLSCTAIAKMGEFDFDFI